MKIVIQTKNLEITPTLKKWIEEKMGSLQKFSQSISLSDEPRVWVEVGRESAKHRKGKIFFAEGQLDLPHQLIRSRVEDENLKKAVVKVKDELQRQLKKYKGRIPKSLTRRRARALKRLTRFIQGTRLFGKGRIREEGN